MKKKVLPKKAGTNTSLKPKLKSKLKTNNNAKISDIAIVGMACRFPGARNYNEYWNNLISGKNCVGEIPKDRWNWEDYYGDPVGEDNKTNIKYGGFIDDVDKFDPLFFNISPREANYMDPQHRVFLESAWQAIEDAGYNPKSLEGRDIGVYAGVSKNDYAELMREHHIPITSFVSTGTVHSILANRVSFLLDFKGKSEVVDTACSSFLVALDKAVNDIIGGFCEAAVVGGVNTILSPTMYISHSKSGMLSEDGSCKSFDAKANGYVRSEGVGVVFIKALDNALADNDNILGVIKGSAVKHGGRSNFLTAPKVSSQASTISAAIKAADINPKTIGYIEAHGTGTPLGDPIEINALKQAFQPYLEGGEQPFCGLSSAKTNVGHLESAAGVAGLIKVLLSFKHKTIPPLLHFEHLNPYISLTDSPFYVVNSKQNWNNIVLNGIEQPLRAGISSFGMGGVNAHVIVEQPPCVIRKKTTAQKREKSATNQFPDRKYIIPLSAKTSEQLQEYALSLYQYLTVTEERASIEDIGFTLLTGREAFEDRAAFIVDDYQNLVELLKIFTENRYHDQIVVGDTRKRNNVEPAVAKAPVKNTYEAATHWVEGGELAHGEFNPNASGHRIQLPVYPFHKRRCWFPMTDSVSKPIVPEQEASLRQSFSKKDYFVRDHVVKGEHVVPGVRCLEVFRAIGEKISLTPVRMLNDIYWMRAIKVTDDISMKVTYTKSEDSNGGYHLSLANDGVDYCAGVAVTGEQPKPTHRLDIEKIKARCGVTLGQQDLYDQFKNNGLAYGETFQVIRSCQYNKKEIICELNQSPQAQNTGSMLEPSLLDGVFQAVVALHVLNAEKKQAQQVPFYLKSIKIHGELPARCYAYATLNTAITDDGRTVFNMYLCDEQGEIVVEFSEFVKREYTTLIPVNDENKQVENDVFYYTPRWVPKTLGMHSENLSSIILFDNNSALFTQLRKNNKTKNVTLIMPGDQFKHTGKNTYSIKPGDSQSLMLLWNDLKRQGIGIEAIVVKWDTDVQSSDPGSYNRCITLLLGLTQSLIRAKLPERVRVLYLHWIQNSVVSCTHASVGGFSRTLAYENPNINITSVGLSEYSLDNQAEVILNELTFYRNSPLNEVQYIGAQRQVRMIVPHLGVSTELNSSLIKQGGTYLIAGGAGGLGYLFAKHLAKNYSARVVLIGRGAQNQKIEVQLNELRLLGGDGQYFSVDISSEAALMAVCHGMRADGIQLNGVLNCAGLIEDAYIINKSAESLARVVAPKLAGTGNLDESTKQDHLDFFVVFSSIASIMPNQGQCDYAAANSFLDAFARYRNNLCGQNKRHGRTLAINWPLWKDGGIGVIKEEEQHLWEVFGMKPLGSEQGLSIFDNIMAQVPESLPDQLVAIEGDQQKIEAHLNVLALGKYPTTSNATSAASIKDEIRRIISGLTQNSREIADSENLTDYGIDSIGISKITTAVNDSFSFKVDPTLFFDFNTVSKIAEHLWSRHRDVMRDGEKPKLGTSSYMPGRALIDMELSDESAMIFRKSLSDQEFFMKDHVVEGLYNVPGACYIEMALQAGLLLANDNQVLMLSNNYWAKQLSTSGASIRADLRFVKKQDCYEYEITHTEGNENIMHALGQVSIIPAGDVATAIPFSAEDLDVIKSRCPTTRKKDEIYKFIHAEGLHVGPSFQPMIDVYLNDREALSHLKLPDFISNTFDDYVLHPSLLTGVLQTALLNNKPGGMNSSKFIPIAIDEILVHKKIPTECYVYTETANVGRASNGISKYNAKVITVDGGVVVEIKGLSLRNLTQSTAQAVENTITPVGDAELVPESSNISLEQVCELLKEILSDSIGTAPAEIETDMALESYGINSVMIVELNRCLEKIFGNLSKTLFFEYKSIRELADYFLGNHLSALERQIVNVTSENQNGENLQVTDTTISAEQVPEFYDDDIFLGTSTKVPFVASPANNAGDEKIAIVGMSGRYPDAKNLSEFWENLKAGRDSITKMPASRFDKVALEALFPDEEILPEEWGGFIDDLDKFDPMFFNISPREAQLIDPQERLFLEVAWEAIEDAGYNYRNLKGQSVGVFVGALWQPYIALGIEQTFSGNLQRPHGLLYSIANRVSFYFDWCGPSLAVDTACSASLTALHLACESLKRNESQSAIVGGVNISLSSSKYLWLSNNNFLSSEGKCRSFGSGGDGYVPGEGVGSVFIKRLSNAIHDNDHIYGVISGTSVNHGGKTNGYTVPNPVRQTELILSSLDKSGVSPTEISYIEAHGTGTSLGDPIEMTGLHKAFDKYTDKKQFCAIGSVKSNIGHLEAAAGIAGLTKLLLQIKHKTLVPSIHSDVLNPNIDFSATPFVLQKELKQWLPSSSNGGTEHSQDLALKAMISSFGAGGSNAHAIVEEYRDSNIVDFQTTVPRLASSKDVIIPVSAKSTERLAVCVANLLSYINDNDILEIGDNYRDNAIRLEDVAYTLQTGRDAMDERVVFLANDLADLKQILTQYARPDNRVTSKIIAGYAKTDRKMFNVFSLDTNLNNVFNDWIVAGDGAKIATLWANGIEVNWHLLYSGQTPRKVSLPTYPFCKERYWIPVIASKNRAVATPGAVQTSQIHPLLHENTSDLYSQRYSSTFTGSEGCFDGSVTKGERTLSSMSYLEMASQAVAIASGIAGEHQKSVYLSNIIWLEPFMVKNQAKQLHIALTLDDDSVDNINGDSLNGDNNETICFEIYSTSSDSKNKRVLHAQGVAHTGDIAHHEKQDLSSLKQKMTIKTLDESQCTAILTATEYLHGNHQCNVTAINVGNDEVLITLDATKLATNANGGCLLHPWALSQVLAAFAGIASNRTTLSSDSTLHDQLSSKQPVQPVFLVKMEVLRPFVDGMYAWVRHVADSTLTGRNSTGEKIELDVDFIDSNGHLCARLAGLCVKTGLVLARSERLSVTPYVDEKYSAIDDKPSGITLSDLHADISDLQSPVALEPAGDGNSVNTLLVPDKASREASLEEANASSLVAEPSTPNYNLTQTLCDSLAGALYMESCDVIVDKQFTDMGLDSIVGVEWINDLNKTLSLDLSATIVYDYPTITSLSNYLQDLVTSLNLDVDQVVNVESNVAGDERMLNPYSGMYSQNEDVGAIPGSGPIQEHHQDNLHNQVNKSNGDRSVSSSGGVPLSKAHKVLMLPTNELQQVLITTLSKALYMNEHDVNIESTFTDMGLDSIVGVEWVQAINCRFDTAISATAVYDYSNIREFTRYLENVITTKDGEQLHETAVAD